MTTSSLINFDGGEDGLVEAKRRCQSHKSQHQERRQAQQEHVPEIKNIGGTRVGLKGLEIGDRVKHHPESSASTIAKGSPPPAMVLATQLEVVEKDGNYAGVIHIHDLIKEGII